MTYNPGTLVRLRSGGPTMTVVQVPVGNPNIGVAWFTQDGELHRATFPFTALISPAEMPSDG